MHNASAMRADAEAACARAADAVVSTERAPKPDPLRGALLDSRQRWRDLVTLAADIAFEVDAAGRFVFVTPEQPLGWSGEALIGRPAALLLAESAPALGFNPFEPQAATRGRRAWIRRPDGSMACLSFAVMPLAHDRGMRGIGQDVTEQDSSDGAVAAALRRYQVLDQILFTMRQEVLAPRMMHVTLDALAAASGAEGAAVIDLLSPGTEPIVLCQTGRPAAAVLATALSVMETGRVAGGCTHAPDGRILLTCLCQTRFGEQAGLVVWRPSGARPWDEDDQAVAGSVAGLIQVILEHESIQREMVRQARTDPLTGLLNRRAFLDEVTRRTDRLDREAVPGTLMFVDLDGFKQLNDSGGHDVGDEALCLVAGLLRSTVRPSDLVARLGGDEFAVWMDGTEELSAAERAEKLRVETPKLLDHLAQAGGLALSMSIGIATRWPERQEDIDTLLQRADQAMYEVKRTGRGHWRVARSEPW